MKATVDTKLLAAALKTVSAASAKTGLAVLTGVRLDMANKQLRLSCTDLELEITTTVEATGTKGSAVMPAGLLTRLVGSLKAERTQLELIGDRLVVTAGSASADFATFRLDDWPQSITVEGTPGKLTSDDLERLGRIIGFAATDVANKGAMCGVHLNGSEAYVTDGYRLGIVELSDSFDKVTIPAQSMRAAMSAKGDGLEISVGPNSASLQVDNTTWTTRLIEGSYPNLADFLKAQERTHRLTFDRQELLDAIELLATVSDSVHTIAITPGDDEAEITTEGGSGTVTEAIYCHGDFADKMTFNAPYFASAVEAADDGEVTIEIQAWNKPVVVKAEGVTASAQPLGKQS